MNIILKELQNCTKFRQAGCRLRALAMLVRADMRHYNIGVNSISRLLMWAGDSNAQWDSGRPGAAQGTEAESRALSGARLWYLGCLPRNAGDGSDWIEVYRGPSGNLYNHSVYSTDSEDQAAGRRRSLLPYAVSLPHRDFAMAGLWADYSRGCGDLGQCVHGGAGACGRGDEGDVCTQAPGGRVVGARETRVLT